MPGGERVGDRAVSRARSIAVVCAAGLVAPVSGARGQVVKFARFDTVTSDMVEIVIGDIVVRVDSDVEPERLAAVIRAVQPRRRRAASGGLYRNPAGRRLCSLQSARQVSGENEGVTLAACFAHIRRRFYELHVNESSHLATQTVTTMAGLWEIEAAIRR